MNDARWVTLLGEDMSAYMNQVFHTQSIESGEDLPAKLVKESGLHTRKELLPLGISRIWV